MNTFCFQNNCFSAPKSLFFDIATEAEKLKYSLKYQLEFSIDTQTVQRNYNIV